MLEAATYIGVPTAKFVQLVRQRRMPVPRRIDGIDVWDIAELADAFDCLPRAETSAGPARPWEPQTE
jgi:hypothetical protein